MSLRYIAATLGLSVTTVSRALAGYSDVAAETRRRVKAEAERIDYVPNATARRLQKGRTDAIGVVAPAGIDAVTDAYLYTAFTSAWSRLSEIDRDLVLLPSMSEAALRDNDIRIFRRAVDERRVDGLLLLRTRQDDWRIPYLQQSNIPFMVFGARRSDMVTIGIDEEAAADLVLDRLCGFGHRRITCIVPEGGYDFAHARLPVLMDKAAARGVEMRAEVDVFSEEGGKAATARALNDVGGATALIYFANRMALGGLHAFAESVQVIARHVSVVSYGDNANLRYCSPPVTAIVAPVAEMVRHAIDVVVAQADGKPIQPIRHWPVTLVQRQSDGPMVERGRRDTAPIDID